MRHTLHRAPPCHVPAPFRPRVALSAMVVLVGCAGPADTGELPPEPIVDHDFGTFEEWASPIEDYQAVGEAELPGRYDPGIHELAPHEGRLWIGYGDGDVNMGTYTPIEFRYFDAPDDSTATAATVSALEGAAQSVPTQSGDEVIGTYRVIDGTLWQAGLDSTNADEAWTQERTDPRAIQGNAYTLEGTVWTKHRSILGGEHVQDVAGWRGCTYAVGSGADLRSEFEAGEVFRYLWVSFDAGATFVTVERLAYPEAGGGDTRWVHLLPTADTLHLFGYAFDFENGTASPRNAGYEGGDVTEEASGDLADLFALGTMALPDGTGLVHGILVRGSPLPYVLWHVQVDGSILEVDLGGRHAVDIALHAATGEVMVLAAPGDVYPAEETGVWDLSVLVAGTGSPDAWTEVATYQAETAARAIAFWEHALFLGTADGRVLRARDRR